MTLCAAGTDTQPGNGKAGHSDTGALLSASAGILAGNGPCGHFQSVLCCWRTGPLIPGVDLGRDNAHTYTVCASGLASSDPKGAAPTDPHGKLGLLLFAFPMWGNQGTGSQERQPAPGAGGRQSTCLKSWEQLNPGEGGRAGARGRGHCAGTQGAADRGSGRSCA